MIYIFKIIWLLNRKVIDRDVVLKIRLFDDLSNNLSFTNGIDVVEILCLYANTMLIK